MQRLVTIVAGGNIITLITQTTFPVVHLGVGVLLREGVGGGVLHGAGVGRGVLHRVGGGSGGVA